MNKTVKISPSLMCCRIWEIPDYIKAFEELGVDSIHFDVMDGHYVKNIMLGTSIYKDIIAMTDIPVDIHLMCLEPERYLDYFNPRANDMVSFHPEICNHPYRLLQDIRARKLRAGIAFNPGTPIHYIEEVKSVLDFVLIMAVNPGFSGQVMVPDNIDKTRRITTMIRELNIDIDVFVDGNTNCKNVRDMHQAGTNGFVIGTTLLHKGVDYFRDNYPKYLEAISGKN